MVNFPVMMLNTLYFEEYRNPAAALAAGPPEEDPAHDKVPLTGRSVSLAWTPFVLMSVLLLLTGFVRQKEESGQGPVWIGPVQTNYRIPVAGLDKESHRNPRLHPVKAEQAAVVVLGSATPLEAAVNAQVAQRMAPKPEGAEFNFAWLTAPGSAVFVAALLSMALLRMNRRQIGRVFRRTVFQMKIPIPTIACMLGLSYVTRYAGMDATLGVAFAETGPLYPFFAAILGWLGVFLTGTEALQRNSILSAYMGELLSLEPNICHSSSNYVAKPGTDAGSNALFGSLQKITATEIYHPATFAHLGQQHVQVLICTANSTGGVMGKMIDAQSICVATAAMHQIGREADIFKAVFWHSILLATIVGLLTLLQAYVHPFTRLVP